MGKPVIVLDPGHGGYDPGAVAFGLEEKDLNLKLALMVAERLDGIKVLLTRERDVFMSLADRVAFSRKAGADFFLSLHANAGGGRGFESFACSSLGETSAAVIMQRSLHGQVMEAIKGYGIVDRGLKRAAFYVLRHNPRPAVLIESLFIDNEREASLWREQAFVEDLAGGVVRGVLAALELPVIESGATGGAESPGEGVRPSPVSEKTLYTVQVGAFRYLENARFRLEEARAAGFTDAYIYEKQI